MPFPPLIEQAAMAAVLSKIQAAVEVQDKIIITLKELKAATMAKIFREGLRGEPLKQTEIGEIPESWEVAHLGSICDKVNYGTSTHCRAEKKGLPVLRIPNVINEQIDSTELKYADLPANEIERLLLHDGDLIFVRTNGNKNYTGRCAVYKDVPPRALFASYLIRVRLANGTILPEFAQAYLASLGREQITSKAKPAADGKYNIETVILKNLLLPRPSLSQQSAILRMLDALDVRLRSDKARALINRQLFSSMLHLLMTGRVRVNGVITQGMAGHAS